MLTVRDEGSLWTTGSIGIPGGLSDNHYVVGVIDGATIQSGSVTLITDTTTGAVVDGPGSRWNMSGDLSCIGVLGGVSVFGVSSGGVLTSTNAHLAANSGLSVIGVNGSGSLADIQNDLVFERASSGSIVRSYVSISQGGRLLSRSASVHVACHV